MESGIVLGQNNIISGGDQSVIVGGGMNTIDSSTGGEDSIIGGSTNQIVHVAGQGRNFIAGGTINEINGDTGEFCSRNAILCGTTNTIYANSDNATDNVILGGDSNLIEADSNFPVLRNVILGGQSHIIKSTMSGEGVDDNAIIGGNNGSITSNNATDTTNRCVLIGGDGNDIITGASGDCLNSVVVGGRSNEIISTESDCNDSCIIGGANATIFRNNTVVIHGGTETIIADEFSNCVVIAAGGSDFQLSNSPGGSPVGPDGLCKGAGSIYLWGGGAIVCKTDILPFDQNVIDIGSAICFWDDMFATNFCTVSDSRLKENVVPVPYGLAEIELMTPVKYNMISQPTKNKLGLIAQDLEAIIPEAVAVPSDPLDTDTGYFMLGYNNLIPVLIKAIQELKVLSDAQDATITTQDATITAQAAAIAALDVRITALEP